MGYDYQSITVFNIPSLGWVGTSDYAVEVWMCEEDEKSTKGELVLYKTIMSLG